MAQYKFYINGREVNPVNAGSISIERKLSQEGRGRYYETILSSPVILDNVDYKSILDMDADQPLYFSIVESSQMGDYSVYEGFTTKSKSRSDDAAYSQIELPIKTSGIAGTFLSNYDQTINMMEVAPIVERSYYGRSAIEFRVETYQADIGVTNPPQPPIPGWGESIKDANGDPPSAFHAIYAREIIATLDIAGEPVPPSGGDWEQVTAGSLDNKTSSWARTPESLSPLQLGVIYFQWQIQPLGQVPVPPPSNNQESWRLLDSRTNSINTAELHLWADETKIVGEISQLSNGRRLTDVLNYAARQASSRMSVESSLLSDDTNYVTGLENELKGMHLYKCADVKREDLEIGDYSRTQDFVLKDFLEQICEALNAFWSINERTGQLRIEHVSYQQPNGVVDVSGNFLGMPIITIEQSETPKREEYSTGDKSIDFSGTDIEYLDLSAKSKVTKQLDSLVREVYRVSQSPQDYPDDSLCLVQPRSLNADDGLSEKGAITRTFYPNVAISQSNLMDKYGPYDKAFRYVKFNFSERSATKAPYAILPAIYQSVSSYYEWMTIERVSFVPYFKEQGIVLSTSFQLSESLLETVDKKGAGLPFYTEKGYILYNNGLEGAYKGRLTPRDELPSFQIWAQEDTVRSIHYEDADGQRIQVLPTVTLLSESAIDNDVSYHVFSCSSNLIQAPYPPCGRYIVVLSLSLGINGTIKEYYSSEITVFK